MSKIIDKFPQKDQTYSVIFSKESTEKNVFQKT
mgnify:CR=1 FL=1